ncbi:uncharacterized protein [Montipora foliosa]|uniref:uncharacterized protein n=1 Tax=Montipora foliosa TaxID=591990 RepID=UPI0035F193AB
MTISMVPGKADVIKSKCHTLVHMQGPVQIREVASVVGLVVSAFSGVQYAPLFYSSLEYDKTNALKCNGCDLEGKMTLSPLSKQDLLWWISNADQYPKPITPLPPDITLVTDSSLKGWGGVIEGTPNVTGGRWSYQESKFHINYLELKAILLVLQFLCNHMQCCHIKLLCDNTTALSYTRNMGGTKSRVCNEMTREIIMWCMARHLTLSISHLPGKLNAEADRASRVFHNSNTKLSLAPSVFNELTATWGEPDIDMFASRLNYKVSQYVAWKPQYSSKILKHLFPFALPQC